VITRIIKAMVLAALVSFCLMSASVVHAHDGKGGRDRQGDNGGWNSRGNNDRWDDRGRNSAYAAPELNPSDLAGSAAFLAAILLLGRHRRKEPKSAPDLFEHKL
jgi:hypothetical protein